MIYCYKQFKKIVNTVPILTFNVSFSKTFETIIVTAFLMIWEILIL